jgi:hypothetical protein
MRVDPPDADPHEADPPDGGLTANSSATTASTVACVPNIPILIAPI